MSVTRVFAKKHETHVLTNPAICPVCGGVGYGVFFRWAKEPQYGPYAYFAHPNGARENRRWCYLGHEVTQVEAPESICLLCPILNTCNPSSTFATCFKGEGSIGPKEESSPDFLKTIPSSTALELLSPPPHNKQCAKCGTNYPQTTERKCTCGGWLVLPNHGHYS